MTSKKQIVVRDQQVKAFEVALEAMDPPIEDQFHTGILHLIIDFAQPHIWFLEDDRRFNISEDALTATRNLTQVTQENDDDVFVVICDNFDITGPAPVGCYEARFRVDRCKENISLGIVQIHEPTKYDLFDIGYFYGCGGIYYGPDIDSYGTGKYEGGLAYATGDIVTIVLDYDTCRVSARMNGEDFGRPHPIEHQVEYHFMFHVFRNGATVTIVGVKQLR